MSLAQRHCGGVSPCRSVCTEASPELATFSCAYGATKMATWQEFLFLVDDEPPAEGIAKLAEDFLVARGFDTPSSAFDLRESMLVGHDDYPKELPVQAFLSRIIHTLQVTAEARRTATLLTRSAVPEPQIPPNPVAGMASTAGALAHRLAPLKTCDVKQAMRDANLGKLSFVHMVEQHVYDVLLAESEAAKMVPRVAFSYIDLTSKYVTPVWMHPEHVGGKLDSAQADMTDLRLPARDLAALGEVLQGTAEDFRFFRTVAQWSACYWRYVSAAVALEQLTWPQAAMHSDIIMQLAEKERCEGRGPYLAFLYDELLRRQIETSARKQDPDLVLDEVFSCIDRRLLSVAEARLPSVLEKAKISGPTPRPPPGSPSSASAADAETVAGTAPKSRAAKRLPDQRDQQHRAEASDPRSPKGGKGESKGSKSSGSKGSKGKSRREQKKDAWFEKTRERIAAKRQRTDEWQNS